MKLLRHLVTFAVLCSFAAALTSVAGASGAGSPQRHPCGTISGARWSVKPGSHWAAKGKSGTKYTVIGTASECATARQWVPRLTRLPVRQLLEGAGAPKGYHCGPVSGGTNSWFGACLKGPKSAFKWAFSWAPLGFHLR